MATIDDKVVAMSFESSKFESGVQNTIKALDQLKASLQKLPSSGKGLDDIGAAAKRIDLSHIGRGVDQISQKLSYFSVAALAIFANLATKVAETGARMVKAISFDPILDGLREYETQINAIQVILSNTAVAGTTIDDVSAALDRLNDYADKTIYNFGEMTKNIGTFTAAGVDLDTSVASIKGLSNVAALAGANAGETARVMYQLSQAISAGRVQLIDWKSVENASIGSAAFKRALTETAVHMGTLKDNAVEMVGPMKNVMINGQAFRASLASKPGEESWLTSDVLTQTLKQLSGDMTDAQLAAEGYTKAEIKSIQTLAKTALASATTVKTFSQLISTTKEQLGTTWADTFKIILGDYNEAKKLFTGMSNAIGGFVKANGEARNKVLADWKALGGRTVLIEAVRTAFQNLGKILAPIKAAFRDIFPAKTGQDLLNLTWRFQDLAEALKPSQKTVENLRRTFRGVFAALDIGKQIVVGIFNAFRSFFDVLGAGDGGFLSFTAHIGDWVVALNEALKKGNKLNLFFQTLGKVIAIPFRVLKEFAALIGSLFSGGASGVDRLAGNLDKVTVAATPLSRVLETLSSAWERFTNAVDNSVDTGAILESIGTGLSNIGLAIGKAASTMNFDAILQLIRTGLFAGLVLMFKNFLGKGTAIDQLVNGFGKGILGNLSGIFANLNGAFKGLSGSMQAMQNNIKAKTLKEIAIAIALLAASLLVISLIDPEKLNSSLGAITILFGQLLGAMAILSKITAGKGFLKLPFLIGGLVGLAIAIDLLAIAVLALSRLSWDELLRGLAGIGGSMLILTQSMGPLIANKAGMIQVAIGIGFLAVSLNVLALAVRQFASMSFADLAKGLGAVAISLGVMAKSMTKMPANPASVAGMLVMAAALNVLALAVKQFASMNLAELSKGLGGMVIALTAMTIALQKMPPKMGVSAAQLLLLAGAMWVLSDAVVKMGGLSLSQMAIGLGALAGSLVILGTALKYMQGNVRGAAALAITATAIGLLAPALVLLGKQSLGSIVKSLIALAGALTIMGVAGLALAPVAPALLALGAAMFLIGTGIALVGAGLLAIAAGISALAVAGPAGIGIMVAALSEFYKTIPELAKNLVLALLAIVDGLAASAPKFVNALVKILNSLLDVIIQASPKVAEAIIALIDALLEVLEQRQDEIIAAGFALLIALIKGIKDNIREITIVVVDIIATFLRTLAANLSKVIRAGVDVIVSFLKGIANNLPRIVSAAVDIIVKFIGAIATNYGRIVTAGANLIIKMIEGVTKNLGRIVAAGADAIIEFVKGITKKTGDLIRAGVDVVIALIKGIGKNAVRLANAAGEAIVDFLRGLRIAINTYAPQIRTESLRLGYAIIDGMTGGLLSKAGELYSKIENIGKTALSKVGGIFGWGSPAKEMIRLGKDISRGLAIGIDKNAIIAVGSAISFGDDVVRALSSTVGRPQNPVIEELGKYVGQSFTKGLRGSQDDVRSAFTELNGKLTDAMRTTRETIASEEEKLEELRKAKKPDTDAIAKAQKIISDNEALLKTSLETRKTLVVSLRDEKKELLELTTQYDQIGEKIKKAQEVLAQAKQTRDSALKGYTDQYATLPDIPTTDADGNPIDQLQAYMEALANQTKAVATYKQTLEQLRKLGLDDATYKKLLEEGTADQSFANQLLAGGKTAVQALNELDAQLMKVSKSLAIQAAKNLYQAGVDSAQGLLDGLTSKNEKIKRAMDDLIEDIVWAIKRKLRIRSPSKVFEEIGKYAVQGLINGFSKSSKFVTDAVTNSIDTALSAMKSSMSKITDIVTNELNPNPVITPILDLSQIRTQSGALAALTNVTPITAAASYGQASAISSAQIAAQMEELSATSLGTSVKFEQNNYSPKALTDIEIYRQTKNQLSQIKSVLAVT